jgi:peptidoglycan/LPS O-acetylase OafA/YrhL
MVVRILGLDALRFLCALCVVQGHLRLGGYLILDRLDQPHALVRIVRHAFNMGFPIPAGPNAVIVFFVISGFCIHYPFRDQRRVSFRQFILRRYVRVGVPALVAAALFYRHGFYDPQDTVLWSVVCEAIYYTLYPAFLQFRQRFGWPALVCASFVAAYAVVALRGGGSYNGNFTAFGIGFTWILGLPCWILGCVLAETHTRFRSHGRATQWSFRLGIIVAGSIVTALRFYAGIGYYWSEPALALLVYAWLGTEIAYFASRKPWAWLERCGRWSYSVYLYHSQIANITAGMVGLSLGIANRLLLEVGAVLAGCYLLYRLVERPSHALARRWRDAPPRPSGGGHAQQGAPAYNSSASR